MTSIVLNRNPAFWTSLAEEPAIRARLLGLSPAQVGELATMPSVFPFASEHGGFLLWRLDPLGRGWDLHALYGGASSRRERHLAGCDVLETIFTQGGAYVSIQEVEEIGASRPPRSFGFRACAEEFDNAMLSGRPVRVRTWIVTREEWRASPARMLWAAKSLN